MRLLRSTGYNTHRICDQRSASGMQGGQKPLMCSLYHLDICKRDNVLLNVYGEKSRGGFANLLHTFRGTGDGHA